MSKTRATPVTVHQMAAPEGSLVIKLSHEGDCLVLHATGEFDLFNRDQMFMACTAAPHSDKMIDLGGVTFMDCGGYRSIVASRLAVEQGGRTLLVRGATEQPARLLDVIARLEGAGVEAIRGIELSPLG